MHHSALEHLKQEEAAAKYLLMRVALTGGTVLAAVIVIVLVAFAFLWLG